MLTERQNFIETIRHGKPDRFANQFRTIALAMATPYGGGLLPPGTIDYEDEWGVHWSWPEGTPGQFPIHTPDKIVIKDMENWRDYVKFPKVEFSDEEWAPFVAMANAIDREKYLVAPFVAPGIFEMCHHLQEIQNCLMNFCEYPDEMHELIDALTDWELKKAEQLCKYIKPDALFHHDDWGSHNSTFISPEMWREFIKPAYAKIYGYYKAHGVEVIIHHSDSYAATIVPDMIDVGIDVWQGVVSTNNIPELIEKYGDKICFMGCIDSAKVDFPGWTKEDIKREVRKACDAFGTNVIHGASIGGPMSTMPGVYDAITEAIDEYSCEKFGYTPEELAAANVEPFIKFC